MTYQSFYSRFLKTNEGKQHYACHSHYYWPDVTRDAVLAYWDDSATYADEKWGFFFQTLVPELQSHIARTLNTSHPEQIVFASNTHELLYRILSCLDLSAPLKVVTTDAEFHSFHRQIHRLNEQANIELISVPTEPFDTFSARFEQAIADNDPHLVFFSQVFFNSGFYVKDIERIVASATNPETLVVVDGYHSFMAKPVDLSSLESRIFYLAGGYKYAQGGEGVCFAHVPKGCTLRPTYTGWFAELGALDKPRAGEIQYSQDGMRFAGATMDFTALYRLRAVFNLFSKNGLTVDTIDAHVQALQQTFLQKLDAIEHPLLHRKALMIDNEATRGHFLTFKLPNAEVTASLAGQLREQGILTDFRGDRLRFGFALYHSNEEINLSALTDCFG